MEIRELDEKDFTELSDLVIKIYVENPDALYFSKKPNKKLLRNMLQFKHYLVSEKDALDYVAFDKKRLVGECEVVRFGTVGKIGVIVDKKVRKKGIAKALVKKCFQNAKKIHVSALIAEVSDSNEIAAKFFRRMGFECKDVKVIENYKRRLIFEKEI